ncbi:hypothetical protein BU17DRAFT_104099 [Hysterangium stoloniferum]|nr:hypothetical protein BU17DRAFT_104099 [Hysterangium stoloniferum]
MPLPTVILRISLQSGAVVNLTPSSKYAWNVLGTDGKNGILGVRSFIKSPPELAVAYMPESWRVIDKPELTASNNEKPNGIDSILLDIPDHFPTQVITVQVAGKGRLPDWAFLEPIAYIDSTQAPVLLLVGDSDRRVPNSQARNYFHALKGRGREVEMLVFPGNGHSLDTVEAELVGWESARNWFERFVER